MSLIKQLFAGYISKLEAKNKADLYEVHTQYPKTVAKRMTDFNIKLASELVDPAFKAEYDSVYTDLLKAIKTES